MADKQIEVKQVVLQIGKKEIALSVDEAKELRRVLDELLGNQQTVYPFWYVYPYPQITYGQWTVTSDTTGTITVGSTV